MKYLVFTMLCIFVLTGCGDNSVAGSAVLASSSDGTDVIMTNLSEAATSADCAGKTIIVTSALSAVQSNISSATVHSWPTDRTLEVRKGGSINPTTKFTGLAESRPEWFGAAVNGVTDDTVAYTKAINSLVSGGKLIVPVGTSLVNNVLLKSNIIIEGYGKDSVLKLVNDSNMNILSTLANHNTGSNSGTRAKDESNSTYMLENVIIRNIYFDGNKANNTHGDAGGNDSVMGASINLINARNILVEGNWLTNNRLDGIELGYSLQGGSDDCIIRNNFITGNVRTGIAQITGKRNIITGNTITGSPTSIDIEANLAGEVNYRHVISGNYLGGTLSSNSIAITKQWEIMLTNNVIVTPEGKSGIDMSGGPLNANTMVSNNILIGADSAAFAIAGGADGAGIQIFDNTIKGYDFINSDPILSLNNIEFRNNTITTRYGFRIFRPNRVSILNNTINLSGGVNAAPVFYVGFGGKSVVPTQGAVIISGNIIRGTGVDRLLTATEFSDPFSTYTAEFLSFTDNDSNVTTTDLYPLDIHYPITFQRNTLTLLGSINLVMPTSEMMFSDNILINSGTVVSLFATTSLFKNVIMTGNQLTNYNLAYGQTGQPKL